MYSLHALGSTGQDAGDKLAVIHLLKGKLVHGSNRDQGDQRKEELGGVNHGSNLAGKLPVIYAGCTVSVTFDARVVVSQQVQHVILRTLCVSSIVRKLICGEQKIEPFVIALESISFRPLQKIKVCNGHEKDNRRNLFIDWTG
jgi:hypothetical protein